MKMLSKFVFGALTGLGLVSAAHAYGPGTPLIVNAVPPGFTACGTDGMVCKPPAGGTTVYVVYGAGTTFATAQGTGNFTCLPKGWVKSPSASTPADLGVPDPLPNVKKTCYISAPTPTPTTTPTPTPTPTTTTPNPAALAMCKNAMGHMSSKTERRTMPETYQLVIQIHDQCTGNISAACDSAARAAWQNNNNENPTPAQLKAIIATCQVK